jgi:starvation-inducible DNA-binding protein
MNSIGLNEVSCKKLTDKLNNLLANYQIFYMNARGFHWNIKGDNFFELHIKFEELYNDAQLKIDEIAERILTLGNTPVHTYSDYLQVAMIKEHKNITNGKEALQKVVDGYAVIMPLERELLAISAESADEGTNALMSDYLRQQEKSIWMYTAYLAK